MRQAHSCNAAGSVLQEKHIREFGVGNDWQLNDDSMKALDAMEDGHRYLWDPSDVA